MMLNIIIELTIRAFIACLIGCIIGLAIVNILDAIHDIKESRRLRKVAEGAKAEEEAKREWHRWYLNTSRFTDCEPEDIEIRRMTREPSGAYPGKVIARFLGGNLILCEEDQAYTKGLRTGEPSDYVFISLHSDEEWEEFWESHFEFFAELEEFWVAFSNAAQNSSDDDA